MEWLAKICLVLIGLSGTTMASAGVRCGSSLVEIGEWPLEVKESCGEPDYVASYPGTTIPGVGVVEEIEHWYYNRGPQQFIRRLEFRNDRLQRVETLGYGFAGTTPGPCSPEAIGPGTSEFELVARCGEPLGSRVEWRVLSAGEAGNITAPLQGIVPVQEWLYEFGDNRYRRVVILRNGRVQRLEKADKPG
ncbi:Protein of unknown function [Marinobacter daqiaonensis]|uniref:DUF2845 domain-containing protein n=1 Tax=Marinobacter daqiaonensis TaxID=650891 RepID=A0A1I6HQA6_9GAMM|nr:DUF2845 domain-containing protein [Marinobacter daqiaonensis]SFR56681.1 Protein of unknown function [Marinobacter daqiaonensis]